ncbi:hypothetical protein GCM10009840_17970 [Pseudolysinimonas kribbensis]|uniref:Uncharacterized protein n=1 Tax=Pseudolysinimonas kribbensis TaxID=433641 RepID=A0ABQ6JZR7_9MICO|nr:hypothetical protein [Pseudolysinimonas kribbensis]GMA93821.1 hypothetical protein GCM10025881_06450 [Pseudolysinimonas kribbensis]
MLSEALARVVELQAALARIDAALDDAGMVWLATSVPGDSLDVAYTSGRERLEAMRAALQGELALVRMGAPL